MDIKVKYINAVMNENNTKIGNIITIRLNMLIFYTNIIVFFCADCF